MENEETTTEIVQPEKRDKWLELKSFLPNDVEQESFRLYLELVRDKILGRDKNGKSRPFEDLALLMYQAKKTRLDPLARQIYGVYRWDSRAGKEVMTIQTGIDGFRAVAQRTYSHAGTDDVIFEEKDGRPLKATVTVHKKLGDEIVDTTASARWGEYVQTNKDGQPIQMWAKMPYLMLGKCAEALALRKAFPEELSGLYVPEEIPRDYIDLELPTPAGKRKKQLKVAEVKIDDVEQGQSDAPEEVQPDAPDELPEPEKTEVKPQTSSALIGKLDEKIQEQNATLDKIEQ